MSSSKKTKGEVCLDEGGIDIPGAQHAAVADQLARHPHESGSNLPALGLLCQSQLKEQVRWMTIWALMFGHFVS